MNTMLFVIATIGFPENLFSSLVEHTVTNLVMYDHTSHTYLNVLSLKILAKVLISSKNVMSKANLFKPLFGKLYTCKKCL